MSQSSVPLPTHSSWRLQGGRRADLHAGGVDENEPDGNQKQQRRDLNEIEAAEVVQQTHRQAVIRLLFPFRSHEPLFAEKGDETEFIPLRPPVLSLVCRSDFEGLVAAGADGDDGELGIDQLGNAFKVLLRVLRQLVVA